MLNKLQAFVRKYQMLQPGDHLVCGVSGGADSMALLWAFYLLKDKLKIRLSAAHFNHKLRGRESDRDEGFVRDFCDGYDIPLFCGEKEVVAGPKGLEAAAREARYTFFGTLSGKIATAHTANDNAETVLMHMVRGTGLKGLGGIAPVSGKVIRPMLEVTRQEVLGFLEAYHIPYVEDSSNREDIFLRNRIRQGVMPLLEQENPQIFQNLSAMALRLREDEQQLQSLLTDADVADVQTLRAMPAAMRSRALSRFLTDCGVKEPNGEHIALAESLVFSENPSARGDFPGGISICRTYDRLTLCQKTKNLQPTFLQCPGVTGIADADLQAECTLTERGENTAHSFFVAPHGKILVRSRMTGDRIRLSGGTKDLKKLFIDKKIPAAQRATVPVLADDLGVLAVYGIGANLDRIPQTGTGIQIILTEL